MVSRAVSHRDAAEAEITKTLQRVELSIIAEDRKAKIESELHRAVKLLPQLVTRNEKVISELKEQEDKSPHEDIIKEVQEAYDRVTAEANAYFDTLAKQPAAGSDKSVAESGSKKDVASKSKASKSSKSSARSKQQAKHRYAQLQEQNDLADQIAALELQQLKDKARRKQDLRAAQFDVLVASDDEDKATTVSGSAKVNDWLDSQSRASQPPLSTDAAVSTAQTLAPPLFPFAQTSVPPASSSLYAPPVAHSYGTSHSLHTPIASTSIAPSAGFVRQPFSHTVVSSHASVHPAFSASVAAPRMSAAHVSFAPQTPRPVTASPANIRPQYQRNLPKWKLDEFNGDPLRWPRWSGQFLSTVDSADISVDEKLAYLSQLCTGKASLLIDPLVHCGASYYDIFARLRSRFGQSHVVVSAHLERITQHPPVRMHNSEQLVDFALAVSSFVNVLQSQGFHEDLNGSTNLALVVQKLLRILGSPGLAT